MDEHETLAEWFEENRTHLRAVAFQMLGSPAEADDAVQEARLRLGRSDTSGVENLGGPLTTVGALHLPSTPPPLPVAAGSHRKPEHH
jgi:RNA polymerase sigma-70 factor (ECF subfamily)